MPRQHKSLPRLFVEASLEAPGLSVPLSREQSNYLVAVLRRAADDELVLFNGRDGAWRARLSEAGRKAASVVLLEQIAPQPAEQDLWYGFAPLKAGRLDYMVQKATEMGVSALQPVITRFTQVTRLKPDRLHANAIEAAEQCEVLRVPTIGPEINLAVLLAEWAARHGDRVLILADEAAASASPLAALEELRGRRLGLLIGPEGGFSDDERAALLGHEAVRPISLGPRILRADTAAVAALAVVQATIGDWR